MSFEANQGQTDPQVRFLSRGVGYSLFLSPLEAVIALNGGIELAGKGREKAAQQGPSLPFPSLQRDVLRVTLDGANPELRVVGEKQLPGKSNYFMGNDPGKWHTNVPNYSNVRYKDVYPGIDLIFYGNQGQLEFDFMLAPGADPRAIRLAFHGAERLRIDGGPGDLVLESEGSQFRLQKPVIYQEIGGALQRISGNYAILGKNKVGFQVGRYDAGRPLLIDPALVYSSYLGKSILTAAIDGIAADSTGDVYISGAGDLDSPVVKPVEGVTRTGGLFVTKINASGSGFVYSTYLASGSAGYDAAGNSLAVDSGGNAYVTGAVQANTVSQFPVTSAAFQSKCGGGFSTCAFVTKLNSSGSGLVFSTYLGGGADRGFAIAVDSSGSAYVAGSTASSNFPTKNAFQSVKGSVPGVNNPNAFVTKFTPDGSALVYSTYLGGSGFDEGHGIAVDGAGNAYVTGSTSASDFPTLNAFQPALARNPAVVTTYSAFVTKLSASGSALLYSTYLGGRGTGEDGGSAIAVDAAGNAYVTGNTTASDFPVINAVQSKYGGGGPFVGDAFVTKFTAAGLPIYSTYLGGNQNDHGTGIAIDLAGNAYVTGTTTSTNFPIESPLQFSLSNSYTGDAFVTKINAPGDALLYSTLLGGGESVGVGYSAIAVDSSGNAYITGGTVGCTGCQQPPAFPLVNALQTAPGFGFFAKIDNSPPSNPISAATRISPFSSIAGLAATSMVNVSGSKFVSRSVVRWNGSDRVTRFNSSTSLSATIPASDISTVGTAQVTVFTPGPGGGTSDPLVFTINPNPVPAISQLVPSSALAGGSGLSLSVQGTGFVPGAVIRWNGSDHPTAVGSAFGPASLTTTLSRADIADPGTAQVTVFNPAPGGGPSNGLTFTINRPPKVSPDGVVGSASFSGPVVAGSGASLFGSDLAFSTITATRVPLPSSLGGVAVFIQGSSQATPSLAPLFFVSQFQINFQVPWEFSGQSEVTLFLPGSNSVTVKLGDSAPGIFSIDSSGTGQGAVLIAGTTTLAASSVRVANRDAQPARRGQDFVSIYCTGLGDVDNRPANGAAALSSPLSKTLANPTVTIGGVPATVTFSGLAPSFVGLYQVNVQVPAGAPTGDSVPVMVSIGGASSNIVTMAVQ